MMVSGYRCSSLDPYIRLFSIPPIKISWKPDFFFVGQCMCCKADMAQFPASVYLRPRWVGTSGSWQPWAWARDCVQWEWNRNGMILSWRLKSCWVSWPLSSLCRGLHRGEWCSLGLKSDTPLGRQRAKKETPRDLSLEMTGEFTRKKDAKAETSDNSQGQI